MTDIEAIILGNQVTIMRAIKCLTRMVAQNSMCREELLKAVDDVIEPMLRHTEQRMSAEVRAQARQ